MSENIFFLKFASGAASDGCSCLRLLFVSIRSHCLLFSSFWRAPFTRAVECEMGSERSRRRSDVREMSQEVPGNIFYLLMGCVLLVLFLLFFSICVSFFRFIFFKSFVLYIYIFFLRVLRELVYAPIFIFHISYFLLNLHYYFLSEIIHVIIIPLKSI